MPGLSVRDQCKQWNEAALTMWEPFAPQRRRITALVKATLNVPGADEPVEPSGSLGVLGAGVCNDLELTAITGDFDRIDLIDLDADAVRRGLARAFPDGAPDHLNLIGDIDFSGLGKRPRNAPAIPAKATKQITRLAKHRLEGVDGPYDRLLSSSMVGPLTANVITAFGQGHKEFAKAVNAVRDAHLTQMVDLLAPGGMGMLMVEYTSSDVVPELPRVPEQQLMGVFEHVMKQGKFFQGCNPNVIGQKLMETGQVAAINGLAPWRYAIGPRVFLVFGVTFLKKHPDWGEVDPARTQIIAEVDYGQGQPGPVEPDASVAPVDEGDAGPENGD